MPLYKIKLINRYPVANQTEVFEFDKPEGFNFKPGQYGGFTLINPKETDKGGITRRFSLLCSPDDNHLAIVTRIQNSAFKRTLHSLAIGEELKFAGPTGNFILHDESSLPAVLIAGGIGIAPFMSMIRYTLKHTPKQNISLFYGNQTTADAAFLPELRQLEQSSDQLKIIPALALPDPDWHGESGFITDQMIKKYIPDLSVPIFYVCGSPAMVTALQETLVEMGIDEERIKVEDFPGY